MWLAALSDSPENEINNLKVQELLTFIESKKSPTDRLVLNLKQSYFAPMKEPDTESIVDRLTQKYPEFQAYLNSVQAL